MYSFFDIKLIFFYTQAAITNHNEQQQNQHLYLQQEQRINGMNNDRELLTKLSMVHLVICDGLRICTEKLNSIDVE